MVVAEIKYSFCPFMRPIETRQGKGLVRDRQGTNKGWARDRELDNNLLLYYGKAKCPFDPTKMLFRGLFYKLSFLL